VGTRHVSSELVGPVTESFLVFPDPAPPEVIRCLDLAGYPWTAQDLTGSVQQNDHWTGAIVDISNHPEDSWQLCKRLKRGDLPVEPVLVLVSGNQLPDMQLRDDLFDDFMITPFHPLELEARLRHLLWRAGRGARPEVLSYGPLTINIDTYQAEVDNRKMDLTFMEYELLKFLTSNPGRVFNRETLLSRVWGYEYYGGARTVDVHIRRLRTKLGEDHAHLIQTVRSVGYKLGQARPSSSNNSAS